jgi:hypothetical protein
LSPYSFSLSTGTLPSGLTLNSTSGAIAGTPTVAGNFTLQVADSNTVVAPTTCQFAISPAVLQITTTSLPSGTQNAAYNATVVATGGTKPYTFSAGSPFPTWLSINPSTGLISGTANRGAGMFQVQVVVNDSSSTTQVASMTYSLTIVPNVFAFVTTSPLPNATKGVQYVEPIVVSGGVPGYNYSVLASTLPTWMTFDVTGTACGTTGPTLCGIPPSIGTASISVTATDSIGDTLTQSFSLSILDKFGDFMAITGDSGTNSSFTVGKNLQVPMTITFTPATTTTLNLTVTAGTPGMVTFSETSTSATSSVYNVVVPSGTPSFVMYVQGVASSGSTTITASAPPYTTATGNVTLANSGFVISGPGGIGNSFTSFEGVTTGLTVSAARLDSNNLFAESQQVASGQSYSLPVAVAPSTLGTLSANPLTFAGGTSSVAVNFLSSTVNSGIGTVSVTGPSGFTTPATGSSVGFTITASGLTLPTLTIGNDLQVQTAITVNGSVSSASTITLVSQNPAQLLFSKTETGAGSASITVSVPANASQSGNFWVRAYGGAPGTVGYTGTSSAFGTPAPGTVIIGPTGFVISTPFGADANFTMSPSTPSATLTIATAVLTISGTPIQLQEVAADQHISVSVTSSNLSVGTISSSPITIAGASSGASTTFLPGTLTNTPTTITAAAANGFQPSADLAQSASVTATLNSCTLNVNNGLTVGQFLEAQGQLFISCTAGSGGTPVTLTSNSPFLQLAVNPTDPGSNSITVTVPLGSNFANYWVYGLGTGLATGEGASPSTVTYSATSATGGSGTDSVTLAPSAILISDATESVFGSTSASVSAGSLALLVITDVLTNDGNNTPTIAGLNQPLAGNAGNNPLLVALTNSNSMAGSLVSPTASIAPGASTGTVTFTPTTANQTTTISVTQPNNWTGTVGGAFGNITQMVVSVGP